MSRSFEPGADKLLHLLAAALERSPFDPARIRHLLPLLLAKGQGLQARILCTMSPHAHTLLPFFPKPDFFRELWPAHTQQRPIVPPSTDGERPFFSVVTPSFNQASYLRETIHSVLRQGVDSYEHIVMDGGSTDGSLELLRAHTHLNWTSEADRGQTHALNKALRMAQGEVIAWINSDDFYLPGAFALAQRFFMEHPEESVLTGDCLWGWENSGRLRYISCEERDFESLIRQWNNHVPGPQPAIFFRRRLLDAVGYPDEALHYGMDYDLWLRIAKAGLIRRHVPAPVAFYRFHNASKSGAQQDWSVFYPDWQTCFTRYRGHSRILPPERMLSVAYPLRADAAEREHPELREAVSLCCTWKLRDMRILLLTDIPGVHEESIPAGKHSDQLAALLPELAAQSLPILLLPVSRMDQRSFLTAIAATCDSFALCMPPISRAIPYEQWYVTPLGALLDKPELPCSPLALHAGRLPAHPLLPPEGPAGCLAMHRVSALRKKLAI
ncbi:MAG: glycosyltransferase [Deltaproteobacteria bacterium]|jgi:GT2 family glycosyltransferase|nr:glycosyltransferase [Deltaproteobacteria bacterium]